MRWLTNAIPDKRSPENERGVSGVLVAGLMLVLIGAGAMAVDVGQIYAERAELQNAADAGALMAADICSETGGCDLDTVTTQAESLADANSKDGRTEVTEVDLTVPGQVTVRTSTWNGVSNDGFLTKLFAQALAAPPVKVGTYAVATWEYPAKGVSRLPLTFATCEFIDDGLPHKVLTSGTETCKATNPSGQEIPGGFAWIDPNGDDPCEVVAEVGEWNKVSSGASLPNECKYLFDSSLSGKIIAIPVYAYTCAGFPPNPALWGTSCTGNNVHYMIEKWAGFRIEAWDFPGQKYDPAPTKFTAGEKGIYGTFLGYSADPNEFSGGSTTPNGNVVVTKLVE